MTAVDLARTAGPIYGHLDTPGVLESVVATITAASFNQRELILLHADKRRLRLLVNLIAQLNTWKITHILVLGFSAETCDWLRAGGRIGCVTSSHQLGPSQAVGPNFVAWLQRFHLLKRLMELNARQPVNVLALDTDMAVRADPYATLHASFGQYAMVTTFDYKGGFANTNIGYIYIRNANATGALHGLFVEFERRISLALGMQHTVPSLQRRSFTTRFLWDQNLWNKVLLSDMAQHAVYLPDGADSAWTASHRRVLRARRYWREGLMPTPSSLQKLPPWGETTERFLWYELRGANLSSPRGAAAGADGGVPLPTAASSVDDGYVNGQSGSGCVGPGGGCGGGGSGERIALAPSWLVSMENGLGLKGKHWLYGATPPPAVLIHYTCTTQTEAARIWPLRLFGHWHAAAVHADANLPEEVVTPSAQRGRRSAVLSSPTASAAPGSSASAPIRLLALEGASLESPLSPGTWGALNLYHALLGGLATLSGRTLVAPATNCTGTGDRRTISNLHHLTRAARRRHARNEPALSGRCFWQVHSSHGVRCVLRIGRCTELATPTEGEQGEAAMRRAGRAPTVVTLDLNSVTTSVIDELQRHADDPLVLLRVRLPASEVRGDGGAALPSARKASLLDRVQRELVDPRLRAAMRGFRARCADLTSGPVCNNICS